MEEEIRMDWRYRDQRNPDEQSDVTELEVDGAFPTLNQGAINPPAANATTRSATVAAQPMIA
jgi:hypothetical protein